MTKAEQALKKLRSQINIGYYLKDDELQAICDACAPKKTVTSAAKKPTAKKETK